MKFRLVENWQYHDDIVIKGLLVHTESTIDCPQFVSFDQPHLVIYKVDDNFYTVFKKFSIRDTENLIFHQVLLKYFEKSHVDILSDVGYTSVVTVSGDIDINVHGLITSDEFKPYADTFEDLLREFYINPEY